MFESVKSRKSLAESRRETFRSRSISELTWQGSRTAEVEAWLKLLGWEIYVSRLLLLGSDSKITVSSGCFYSCPKIDQKTPLLRCCFGVAALADFS